MDSIELLSITKESNRLTYNYKVSSGISRFFTKRKFTIWYPCNISHVPDSILAIPFVANVLPIAWITDSYLLLQSLDQDFYNCLPELKKAFSAMFPETDFGGSVIAKIVEKNAPTESEKAGFFYSGGVDSFQTLISHLDEEIDPVSIWGSDIEYDNENGWEILNKALSESLEVFNLKQKVIHSTFRLFDNEGLLHHEFSKQLKDSWWHGLQHGIGLLGHAAPLAYCCGYKRFYIASTHCFADANVRCSSNPTTDNCVRFCGCQVIHDGFNFRRQDKIKNIVAFSKNNPGKPVHLHVCWEKQTGDNCCSCEKCARTIYAILIEGGDPKQLGFDKFTQALSLFGKNKCLAYLKRNPHLYHCWFDIADSIRSNAKLIRNTQYWSSIKWLRKIKRDNPRSYSLSCIVLLKSFAHKVIARFFRLIDDLKYHRWLKHKKKENYYFLLGTPTHCNIGDAAIVEAEIAFLRQIGFATIEITTRDWERHKKCLQKALANEIVLFHGGGNFGDLWPKAEAIREDIIKNVKAKRFILMPQTFYLSEYAPSSVVSTLKNIYNNGNFTLFARERFSYLKMKDFFPSAKVLLVPDIVLFLKNNMSFDLSEVEKKKELLLVLRNDKESIIGYDEKMDLLSDINSSGYLYTTTDMYHSKSFIPKNERLDIIKKKVQQLSDARVVITDRLHGMVFSYLAGTPCVVLSNNHYKVRGVYEWIADVSNSIFADETFDITQHVEEVLKMNNMHSFDDELFKPLKDELVD